MRGDQEQPDEQELGDKGNASEGGSENKNGSALLLPLSSNQFKVLNGTLAWLGVAWRGVLVACVDAVRCGECCHSVVANVAIFVLPTCKTSVSCAPSASSLYAMLCAHP